MASAWRPRPVPLIYRLLVRARVRLARLISGMSHNADFGDMGRLHVSPKSHQTAEANMLTLRDLGVDHDPGTAWHPKPEKFGPDGLLPDLTDDEVTEHLTKPERADQPDADQSLAAEDSTETPDGEV